MAGIRAGSGFFYAPEARTWITAYPADAIPKAEAIYAERVLAGMRPGLDRPVPEVPAPRLPRAACVSSQWFECPCHGSQYNRVGEKKAGPAPRGMDHFPVTVAANGDVTVDTGIVVNGPADRHQHHRPGGRRSALRRSSRSTDAGTCHDVDRVGPPRGHRGRLARLRLRSTSARRARELGSEIELAANRKPYFDDEDARGPAPRARAALRRGHARDHRRSACRSTGSSSPSRMAGATEGQENRFVDVGLAAVRTDRRQRLQLRRLPRRDEGHRRRRPVQHHRPAAPARSRRSTGTRRR